MTIQIYVRSLGKITWCRDYQLQAYYDLIKDNNDQINYNKNGCNFSLIKDNYFNIAILIREDNTISGYIGEWDNLFIYLKNKIILSIDFMNILDEKDGLYNFKFLSSKNKQLLEKILNDPTRLNYLIDSLFILKSINIMKKKYKNILIVVYLHYGKTMKKLYRESKYIEISGVTTEKNLEILDKKISPVYCVCGSR